MKEVSGAVISLKDYDSNELSSLAKAFTDIGRIGYNIDGESIVFNVGAHPSREELETALSYAGISEEEIIIGI